MRFTTTRMLAVVALLLSAYVLQSAFLARIGLPGAVPDLLLVIVIGLAMSAGSTAGTVIGFSAGVLIGLAPPGSGPLGQTAAVYAIVGFSAGHLSISAGRPPTSVAAAVGGLCGSSVVAVAILGAMVGSHHVSWSLTFWLTVTSAVYGMALAFVALPVVMALVRGTSVPGRVA